MALYEICAYHWAIRILRYQPNHAYSSSVVKLYDLSAIQKISYLAKWLLLYRYSGKHKMMTL